MRFVLFVIGLAVCAMVFLGLGLALGFLGRITVSLLGVH